MFKENIIDKILRVIKKLIPKPIFDFFAPAYHWSLAIIGALIYSFPSRSLKIIGVTGTKGKSTTVYMITKIFEDAGFKIAAIGSLGFKIGSKEWPNTLKMTMPGRMKLQNFLAQAKKAGCDYIIMEVTSEGLAQHRLAGVSIDCAVITNLHKEHIESHGSFENYIKAKQKLFLKTRRIHILNIDDPYFEKFANYPAKIKITYGRQGLINSQKYNLNLKLLGDFNESNALASLAVADAYRLDLNKAVDSLNSIESIPGRMEIIDYRDKGTRVIIDYAHTPDSLELVYKNLKQMINSGGRLIGVLGAAGGGRDKWKRPEFGRIADKYCDQIILTNEDPYDEDPGQILSQIKSGISNSQFSISKVKEIMNRGQAIEYALAFAQNGDIIVITGKGSETSIAANGGKKIPWSDREIVLKNIQK